MFCIASFLVSPFWVSSAPATANWRRKRWIVSCGGLPFDPVLPGFDQKMKAKLVGGVLTRSETAAAFINKNFEIIAWVFVILLAVSSFFAIRGIYYYYVYGSCNGLNQTGFCAFDPKRDTITRFRPSRCSAKENPPTAADLTVKPMDLISFSSNQ